MFRQPLYNARDTDNLQCDGTHPVCNRCKKAKIECGGIDSNFLFLNENEYAVGQRKRPRGPNMKTALGTRDNTQVRESTSSSLAPVPDSPIEISPAQTPSPLLGAALVAQDNSERTLGTQSQPNSSNPTHNAPGFTIPLPKLRGLRSFIFPSLDIPLETQALNYYSRSFMEVSPSTPEIMCSHLKHVLSFLSPSAFLEDSILSLAIHSVSHATFGRARRSHSALTVGRKKYSNALVKTNVALKDREEVTRDEVLLAVMLLSFYENSVLEKSEPLENSSPGIQGFASKSFAHHDGAMAVLNLRRQLSERSRNSVDLDKLVRRQLIRTLLLRSMPLPMWMRDGKHYGEEGVALDLDRCMVDVAELRSRTSFLSLSHVEIDETRLRSLLTEAEELDKQLLCWADALPQDSRYMTRIVRNDKAFDIGDKILDDTVQIYPTVGHAGMWNRYRVLRLITNDIILKILAFLPSLALFPPLSSPASSIKVKIHSLANDLCASIPYMLGLIELDQIVGQEIAVVGRVAVSRKSPVKATEASFLCWPLVMSTMVDGIEGRQKEYLKKRLLEVSEIVNDGVLERVAGGKV